VPSAGRVTSRSTALRDLIFGEARSVDVPLRRLQIPCSRCFREHGAWSGVLRSVIKRL